VPASYSTNTAAGNPVAQDPVIEYDVAATGNQNIGNNAATAALLFDTHTSTDASGWNFVSGSGSKVWNLNEILITSAVGTNNVTINNGGTSVLIRDNTGGTSVALDQFNIDGEFIMNSSTGIENGGTTNLTQSGPGTVVFNNTNSYTGATYLNGGTTEIASDAALTTNTTNVNLNGGTVLGNYTGSLDNGSSATAHPIVLGNNGGGLAATTSNTFTVDGAISGAAGTGPLVIGIPASTANGGTLGLVPGTGSGTANATSVFAAGTVILSDASNSYTGGTVIDSGILQLAGAGTLANFGTGGITLNGGTFQWSSNTTDISTHGLTLAANSGNTFDTNGNNVTLASSIGGSGGFTKVGANTLTLNGANTFTGAVTLNAGNLTIGGANVYTGATAVNAGTLTLNSGASLGNTAITVATTLAANPSNGTNNSGNIQIGSTNSSLTLNAGASLNLTDGASFVGTLTVGGVSSGTGLNLAGTSIAPEFMTFGVGSTGVADELVVSNGAAILSAGGTEITLAPFGSSTPGTLSNIPLLYVPNTTNFMIGDFILETPTITSFGGGDYTTSLTLNGTDDELFLDLTPAVVNLNYYWKGGTSGSWSAIGNFATDHAGATPQSGSLSSISNVFLTADSASNYSQTLDGSYTINSLTLTGTSAVAPGNTTGAESNQVTLAPGNSPTDTLTIDAGNSFTDADGVSYGPGLGLEVQAGSAAQTISANINLGSSQTWEIDSANALLVSGTIANAPSTVDVLTKTGAGELILSGSNTYSGGTTVSAGTLALSAGGSVGSAGVLTVQGTGTFDLVGNNQTVGGLSDGGVSTGIITSSTGSAILTLNPSTSGTFSGTITDNNAGNGSSLALTVNGPSTETLSGVNTYSGLTTVNGGTLVASSNHALGSATSATGGLNMTPASGTAVVDFTSTTPSIASLASSGNGNSDVVLGSSSNSPTTLTVGGGHATTVFGGVISDLSGTYPAAIGSLTVSGGSLTLNGTDTFTGTTVVSGGTLTLGSALALQDSTLYYNGQGGTLSFGTLTAATLAGLTGSENLALTNGSSAAVALTIGNNNVTSSYTGNLGGLGSVTKVGTGMVTLSDATYSGATTISTGILVISGGSFGASGSNINVNGTTAGGDLFQVTGGTVTAGTVNIGTGSNETGVSASITGSASANFTSLFLGSTSDSAGSLTIDTTGSVSLGTATIGKLNTGAAANTGLGIIIQGGTVTATSLDAQGDGDKSTDLNITGGSLTIGNSLSTGAFQIGNAGDGGYLNMSGGALTYLGTDGLVLATAAGSTGSASITGGTATLTGITLNSGNTTSAISALTVGSGAILYLGSVGLVANEQVGSTVTVSLGTATVGAYADWSSSAPITLTGVTTFQTANASSAPFNITLSGALTGTGGLTATGAGGILTLSAADSYNGATSVNSGTTIVSGSLSATTSVAVATGATLEVDGAINNASATVTSAGTLDGVGSISGPIAMSDGGILAPGLSAGSTATGALTAADGLTFSDNITAGTFSIRLGVDALGGGLDNDSVAVSGGSVTLDDTILSLTLGANFGSAPLDTLYTIISGGAGSSGSSTDVFAGPGVSDNGDLYTDGPYQFDILYASGVGDDNVELELVAVPEPGTWASLIGGLGMLVAWQRSRRRRS
jgi:autotransporter-associated beta strand protein